MSGPLMAQPVDAPNSERQTQLIRMVRQDCGSCHGIHLTGGLGPALTPDAVSSVPLDSLTATIYAGRPGTPMPGWKSMLTEAEARWIASKLQTGFPVEKR
jgi:cytochrome c55X